MYCRVKGTVELRASEQNVKRPEVLDIDGALGAGIGRPCLNMLCCFGGRLKLVATVSDIMHVMLPPIRPSRDGQGHMLQGER